MNLNLENPKHRKAWELLQSKRYGERTDFLVDAVLRMEQEDLEAKLRKVVKEELSHVEFAASTEKKQPKSAPQAALDFLTSL